MRPRGGGGQTVLRPNQTVLRNRMTAKRKDNSNTEFRDAYMNAMICGLFPLADSGDPPPKAAPAPMPQLPGSPHGGLVQETAISVVSGDNIKLSAQTINMFKSRLAMKAEPMKRIPDPKIRTFGISASKFLEQTASFSSQLTDFKTLLTFISSFVDRELRPLNLSAEDADKMFLAIIDLFVGTVKEALDKEANARAVLAHPLLATDHVAVKSHLNKFLQGTKGIQGTAKTPLADWLRVVFDISQEEHNATIISVKKSCSDKVAYTELDRYVKELESSNVPTAQSNDWENPDAYERWRQIELHQMKGFRKVYELRHPNARPLDEQTKMFLPPKRALYYKIVLKKCLEHDLGSVKPGAKLKEEESDLSKASKLLLSECATRWQLSKDFRELALMEVMINSLEDGTRSLSEMIPKLQPLFKIMDNMANIRSSDIAFHLSLLKKLDERMQNSLKAFEELLKGDPAASRETMQHIVATLHRINQDKAYQMYGDGLLENVTDKIVDLIQEIIITRYRDLTLMKTEDEISSMIILVKSMTADMDKFSQHFPDVLLGSIKIPRLLEGIYLKNFLIEMENLKYVFTNLQDVPIDNVLGPHGLYTEVTILYSKLDPETLQTVPFNAEEYFRPFIIEWLGRTDDKWKEWVQNACKVEM
ncbi:hypothetical protein HK101_001836, partial [Irineochytrium annulatum]